MFGASVTLDGRYLVRYSSRDTAPSSLVHIAEIGGVGVDDAAKYGLGQLEWREIVGEWGSSYSLSAFISPWTSRPSLTRLPD